VIVEQFSQGGFSSAGAVSDVSSYSSQVVAVAPGEAAAQAEAEAAAASAASAATGAAGAGGAQAANEPQVLPDETPPVAAEDEVVIERFVVASKVDMTVTLGTDCDDSAKLSNDAACASFREATRMGLCKGMKTATGQADLDCADPNQFKAKVFA